MYNPRRERKQREAMSSRCGGARGRPEKTVYYYGGAGYYGWACLCKPEALYSGDKEGCDGDMHLYWCKLWRNSRRRWLRKTKDFMTNPNTPRLWKNRNPYGKSRAA